MTLNRPRIALTRRLLTLPPPPHHVSLYVGYVSTLEESNLRLRILEILLHRLEMKV